MLEVFSFPNKDVKFDARKFYEEYKGSPFLQDETNVRNILSMPLELDHFTNGLKPGQQFKMKGMYLRTNPDRPLTLTKSEHIDERDVPNDEFTARRLRGLTAAYLLDNDSKFEDITAIEAEDLGLFWRKEGRYSAKIYHKIYLSAVSGAEYFVDHFGFYPHVCGVKKYQLKLITAAMIINITNIRSNTGERISCMVSELLTSQYVSRRNDVNGPALTFYGTFDITEALEVAPAEVKWLYQLGLVEWHAKNKIMDR